MKKRHFITLGLMIISFFLGSFFTIPEGISLAVIVVVGFILLHELKPFLFKIAGMKKEGR